MKRGDSGFTLLELVLALTILSAMSGIVAVLFRTASASIARGEETARESDRLRAGMAIVDRMVRSADPLNFRSGGKDVSYFRGERNRLRFLSAAPPSARSGGGIRLVALRVGEKEDGGLEVAEASPFRAAGVENWEGEGGARTILPAARKVAFAYTAGPDKAGAWKWTEAWDAREEKGLPAAVRVELTTAADGGTPMETSFVVPVQAGG